MDRDAFAKQFIEGAASRGASKEDIAKVLPQALADFDSKNTKQPSLADQAGGAINTGLNFLFPRASQEIPKIAQAVQQGQQMGPQGVQPSEAIGALAGPLGAYLSTAIPGVQMPERQRAAYGLGAEAANYALPVQGASQLASSGLIKGAAEGISSPKDVPLAQRAVSGVGEGALGYGLGKALEGVVGLFQGDQLKKLGNNVISSQYNVPRSAGNAMKLKQTVDELAQYGITNVDDIPAAADKVTGSNGIISQVTREAAAQAKPLDTTGLRSIAASIASDPSIPTGQDDKLRSFLIESAKSDPMDALDSIRTLESKAASLIRGRPAYMVAPADKAMSNAMYSFADEMKNRLYDAGAGDAAVKLIQKPEVLDQLAQVSPELAKRASQITNLDDLRSLAAPFVRGAQLADITQSGATQAMQGVGGSVRGVGRLFQNPFNLLALPLSTNTANSTAGNLLRGANAVANNVSGGVENISPALMSILFGSSGR